MKVMVQKESGPATRGVAAARIERAARVMLRVTGLPRAELSIFLCGDREIHALNRDYRSKDRPTDVLAFAMREGSDGARAGDLLGDVVISIETARRQAAAQEQPVISEVLMLLAHGLLHLLGWDHDTDAKDRRMRREVARLVEAARADDRTRRTRARAKSFSG